MSATVALPGSSPVAIPVREIAPWIVFGVVMLLALYFVGAEEGRDLADPRHVSPRIRP